MNTAEFATFLSTVPESPGVYLFKDAEDRVIYVGKALVLPARLRSYTPGSAALPKQETVARAAVVVETIVTRSELEALMLERTLIQKYRPRHNVLWRDNKSYPYLELTVAEEFPRLYLTRRGALKGARRYGPYTASTARRLVRIVNQVFRIPSCKSDMDGGQTPCLYHHLGWCPAPCAGRISREEYSGLIAQVRMFLDGRGRELSDRLKAEMDAAAAREDFETAAMLRDRLKAIAEILEDQAVISPGEDDADVLGLARSGSFASVSVLAIRGGKLTGKAEFGVRRASDVPDQDLVATFLEQHYPVAGMPPRIVLPCPVENSGLLAEWLGAQKGDPVRITSPKGGKDAELLELANANARASLVAKGRVGEDEAKEQMETAVRVFSLPREPRRLEAVDLSHLGGTEAVGAVVVFRDGLPSPREYRKYLIRTARGGDDPESVREVVRRRLERIREDGGSPPDLLLIDGGPGQLKAAELAAAGAKMESLPILALAKREESVYLPGRDEPVRLPEDSPALHLLERARDEVHRYVNAYQRKRRAMSLRQDARGLRPARARKPALPSAAGGSRA